MVTFAAGFRCVPTRWQRGWGCAARRYAKRALVTNGFLVKGAHWHNVRLAGRTHPRHELTPITPG